MRINIISSKGLRFGRSLGISLLGLAFLLSTIAAYAPKAGAVGQYVKYSWSDRVYRVTGANSASYVSWSQYVAAGGPPVSVVAYIPGSSLYRYATLSDEIYVIAPDRIEGHHLTFAEWGAMGYRGAANVVFGFVRVNNGPAVYMIYTCASGYPLRYIALDEWRNFGYPNTLSINYSVSCV